MTAVARLWWALLCLAWAISGSVARADDRVVDLQLRWHHQFQFAGYYAAVEKGFYQEEGLEVRLHAGDAQHQPITEVLAGRVQYAQSNSEVLQQRLLGQPFVALAAIFQHSPSVLLTLEKAHLEAPQDLVGKTVMLLNVRDDADFLTMFLNEGIALAGVNIVPSSYNFDDLVTGKADAINAYLTNEPYHLQQQKIPYKVIDPSHYGVNFYSDILFTTEAEIRDHPNRVQALRRATLKGWRYAMDHPDEIIELLLNKYRVEKSREHLQFEANEMRKLVVPDLIEIGHMNPWRWQHMAETFVKAGLVASTKRLDGFVYDASPRSLPTWVMPLLGGALALIIAISVAASYLLGLNRRLAQSERTLKASHDRLDKLSQHLPGMIYQYRLYPDGRSSFPYASEGIKDIYGFTPDQVHDDASAVFARGHPDDLQRVIASIQQSATTQQPWIAEFRVQLPEKGLRWIYGQAKPERQEDGSTLWHGYLSDITARKQTEVRLQLAASVFSHAREGIMITDAKGLIVEINDTFTRITGYSRDEALGRNPSMLNSGRQPTEFYDEMWRSLREKGHWYGEAWNRRKNGELYAEMITISAVADAAGTTQNYVALFTDITPMKEHQQHLEHIAHFDVLTGLPNRVLLADRLQQAMAQSLRHERLLAVVFLDLDGFKAVNDAFGHDVGDALLVALAQRMKAALREGDTLSRFGGDEFVAVLVDLEHAVDCEPVLQRILQAASDPVAIGETSAQVSASMGVTLYPQDGADADQLMRHADQAMYLAKQAGKNRYHLFDVAQDSAVKIQREGVEQVRMALEQRQFVLHYQPKVNMQTGAVIGAEALIRWQHPQRGLLAPAAFLPTIEDHAISIEIGEWVIATALMQMNAWQDQGLALPVSVNIGARQLQQEGFAQRVAELIAVVPNRLHHGLELEILETSALEDISHVSDVMHACRAAGVSFALDDFGTGYSSLTYLKHLPAEMLKIDQSFVRDMLTDADDLAIVGGIIGLAKAFGRQVIAEGVESAQHGKMLLSMGCGLAQGYGIARPMPAEQMPDWVAQWRSQASWQNWQ
jgi:diguanylate cyclase (GGDEF)-like protein/PAS domain S-box-containing protein